MLTWAVAVVLGAALVEWLLLTWRFAPYFALVLPLPLEPLPVPHAPEGEGRSANLAWASDGRRALYQSTRALPGLHGVVVFVPDRNGVRLDVRWAPPWSLVVWCGVLGTAGVRMGVGGVAITLSVLLLAGALILYQQAAVRAAAELRWAWVRDDGA